MTAWSKKKLIPFELMTRRATKGVLPVFALKMNRSLRYEVDRKAWLVWSAYHMCCCFKGFVGVWK